MNMEGEEPAQLEASPGDNPDSPGAMMEGEVPNDYGSKCQPTKTR